MYNLKFINYKLRDINYIYTNINFAELFCNLFEIYISNIYKQNSFKFNYITMASNRNSNSKNIIFTKEYESIQALKQMRLLKRRESYANSVMNQ